MRLTKLRLTLILLAVAGIVAAILVVTLSRGSSTPTAFDWKAEWSIERGFNIAIDAHDFQFPTSMAFVTNPGDGPKDPLYFVTELRGRIKVVTNDRTVLTFAEDFFTLRPERVVPVLDEEVGMAGICLASQQGQVFVTFSYHDTNNILRNNIVRFQSIPETFSLTPTSLVDFTEIFDSYPSIRSHQIGPCQVEDELLYVSVADGGQHEQSQLLDSVLGKVLRMDLDGKPVPENPFYQDSNIEDAQNYVWAYGLRNPFVLKVVDGQVFVADNGPGIDRFLQIKQGENYLWDGTNNSIGTNADAVLSPGRGVAHMEHYPADSNLFPDRFGDNFFMTLSGNPVVRREGFPAILAVPYDLTLERLSAVPRRLLQYRGAQIQVVAALAFGPDGLYFAPLLPDPAGLNGVYKITFQPENAHPHILEDQSNPVLLMRTQGCFACHTLNENRRGTIGPNLDQESLVQRLDSRLNSQQYTQSLKEVDELEQEPFVSFRDARQAVDQAQGLEKIRLWLRYRILEPRFDDPRASMPQLGLSRPQAKVIADYLAGAPTGATETDGGQNPFGKIADAGKGLADWVQDQLPIPTHANARKFLAAFFGVGLLVGIVSTGLAVLLLSYRHKRRIKRQASENLP